jgi:hypothetical protein
LNSLLCKINQSWSEPHQEITPFVNRLDFEESRQLLEVLLSASSFFNCPKYFELAYKIVMAYLAVKGRKCGAAGELLMMEIAFVKHFPKNISQQHIDAITSEMTSLIDEEGVSTKSIGSLNRLGEFLF